MNNKNNDSHPDMTVRVMSYNIHSGIGMDGRYDADRIADVIRSAGADIVGLQEADVHWGERSRYDDTPRRLADRLGMHLFFAPIYTLAPEDGKAHERQFGVALLSKFPIVRAENRRLTRLSTQDAHAAPSPMPGFLEAVLDVKGTPLTVYVTHLDFRSDPAIRSVQVDEMLDMMARRDGLKLLIGDFNARPDAAELCPLFSAMRDTWTEVKRDPGFTFPADAPDRKIDYILAGPGLCTVSSAIVDSDASDHRPIVAELRLKNGN